MGIAHPAVADQRRQAPAGVRQFKGPEFIEPGSAQRGANAGDHQNGTYAHGGERGGREQRLPQRVAGRRYEGTRVGRLIAHICGEPRWRSSKPSTTRRARGCATEHQELRR
jgi:hypothetical protein